LQDNDGQKVIIRECEQWEDEDSEEYETRTTSVKGFDDVKAEVEEFYKEKIEDLEKKIEDLRKEKENYGRMYLDALCTISDLKHRTLWQRIINENE
jgi:phage host-nuclease inhibitor protein Gam